MRFWFGHACRGPADLERQLADGVEALKARGKSDVGAKTMLDTLALAPVFELQHCNCGAIHREKITQGTISRMSLVASLKIDSM